MSLRAYLTVMSLATALALSTLALVIFRVDPEASGTYGHALFYVTLFFSIIGLISLFGLLVRIALHPNAIISKLAAGSFRQSVILAALAVSSLFLYKRGTLVWWNGIVLVAAATITEFFFLSLKEKTEIH